MKISTSPGHVKGGILIEPPQTTLFQEEWMESRHVSPQPGKSEATSTGTPRAARQTSRAPAEMHVSFESTEEFLDSYAGNIGVGGLMLRTAAPALQIGEELALQFGLPGTESSIRATGQVVWRHEPGTSRGGECGLIGLRFVKLMAEDRSAIASYVRNHAGLD